MFTLTDAKNTDLPDEHHILCHLVYNLSECADCLQGEASMSCLVYPSSYSYLWKVRSNSFLNCTSDLLNWLDHHGSAPHRTIRKSELRMNWKCDQSVWWVILHLVLFWVMIPNSWTVIMHATLFYIWGSTDFNGCAIWNEWAIKICPMAMPISLTVILHISHAAFYYAHV